MKRLIWVILIAFCVVLSSSCGTNSANAHVVVVGSTSVQPYVEILEEEYRNINPENAIDIHGGGSSAGINAVANHTADIGMSSRALKGDELNLWSVVIAKDGLALIIHPDNPINDLSIQQIRDIYTLKITNWSQVGGVDAKIHIIAREEGSGTRSAFQDLVMGDEFISQKAVVQNTNGFIKQTVSGDVNAIGFISLGIVDESVKAVSLEGVAATQENLLNGSYGLYRSFLFVSETEPVGAVKHFIDFVLSEKGQAVLVDEGLISVRGGQTDEEV